MKNIEVEVRGPLTKKQFINLRSKLSKEGKFIAHKNRVAICYPDPETGSLVENCNTDIRIRSTNGVPEIIIKKGKWGAIDENRREFSLVGKPGEFHKMVMMLGALGFDRGVVVVRRGEIHKYKGVEFSLVEVPNHSYFFEAEIMAHESEKEKAREKIGKICKDLGLELFGEKDFYDYINILNKEANQEFIFEEYDEDYFQKTFPLNG
jgi:predicted adenylyl cyclase CyaB